jgi:hypothetical protein
MTIRVPAAVSVSSSFDLDYTHESLPNTASLESRIVTEHARRDELRRDP